MTDNTTEWTQIYERYKTDSIKHATRCARIIWNASSPDEKREMSKHCTTLENSFESLPADYELYESLEVAIGIDFIWDDMPLIDLFEKEFFLELGLFATKHHDLLNKGGTRRGDIIFAPRQPR